MTAGLSVFRMGEDGKLAFRAQNTISMSGNSPNGGPA
jgi:hypothetical protein